MAPKGKPASPIKGKAGTASPSASNSRPSSAATPSPRGAVKTAATNSKTPTAAAADTKKSGDAKKQSVAATSPSPAPPTKPVAVAAATASASASAAGAGVGESKTPIAIASTKPAASDRKLDEKFDPVVADFNAYMNASPNCAIAVAAIQALSGVVSRSAANTMMELQIELKAAADRLTAVKRSSISLSSGCELFNRHVTRMSDETPDFAACKSKLIARGEWFAQVSNNSRLKIAKLVDQFIKDGKAMLIHGYSRVVNIVLLHAAREKKYFTVYVTEGRPDCAGYQAAEELIAAGIPVTLVLDSAVGYIMEKVDFVLMGAEGVVENGGIINKIGTYQIAMIARALKKPFYVAAEAYKFARLFPLSQSDLPESPDDRPPLKPATAKPFHPKLALCNPSADYTPPLFITLLFTDLGVLTPSAVSDELIKLYT